VLIYHCIHVAFKTGPVLLNVIVCDGGCEVGCEFARFLLNHFPVSLIVLVDKTWFLR